MATTTAEMDYLEAWDTNAAFWDNYMGAEGNEFYNLLELPALERLANVQEGEHALDLATGNGLFARRLATLGAIVTATDASEAMLDFAQKRTTKDEAARITYRTLDVTQHAEFDLLASQSSEHDGYDIITMNMALMDIPTLEPLAAALVKLLKFGGRFVTTVLHPVFLTQGAARNIELGEDPTTGRFQTQHSIKVMRYLDIPPAQDEALHGQPVPQVYFHRSLQNLLRPFLQAGLVLDGLEEPAFADGYDREKIQSYSNFEQIPPVMALRFRR